MTPIETDRLVIRNWRDDDRDLFFEINSDPDVMEFFSFRRTRKEAAVVMEAWHNQIAKTGLGFMALALKDSDEAVGFIGLAPTLDVPGFKGETVEIGWRLARRHWGQGYATEGAHAALRYGFAEKQLPEIVSYAVTDNWRSRAVMERLGLRHVPKHDFDHPAVPDTHPHLKAHAFYLMTREEWLKRERHAPNE